MSILEIENLEYRYGNGNKVIDGLNIVFETGKMIALTGKSGAGKTTLVSLLSGLTSPTGGKILYENQDLLAMDKYDLRSKKIGVIFQGYNLLPRLTAKENVILSMDVSGKSIANKDALAAELLLKVHLSENLQHRRVLKLSGGEQQRVAIARALSYDPQVILADEPTGNLDQSNTQEVLEIFRNLANEGKCIIIATHDPQVTQFCDQVIHLEKEKEIS
jgi:putative ABC transport system ATP-binding protein